MSLITPYWFPARQGKAEEVGPNIYRLNGPNLQEAFIRIEQPKDGRWLAALRLNSDGPDIASTGAVFHNTLDAWEAAFELYREQIVV
jgi:hypothetical protein